MKAAVTILDAVILDVHSYPADPLPYELHPRAQRPEVCLGVDDAHTPEWLLDSARAAFTRWDIAVDEPFVGCYVPLAYYGRARPVYSLMVEIRRDTYQDSPDALTALATDLGTLIARVCTHPTA